MRITQAPFMYSRIDEPKHRYPHYSTSHRRRRRRPMAISRVDNMVRTLLLLLMGVFSASRTHQAKAQSEHDMTIRYEIPEFGMKLIILDEEEVSSDLFREALAVVVTKHLDEYLKDILPPRGDTGVVNRESFSNVTLVHKVLDFPLDPDEFDGVKLSIVRAGFEGVGNFLFSSEVVQQAALQPDVVEDPTHLLQYVKDAFREDGGFWDLAAEITKDDVLSRTGKLQIAVGNLIVAEGTLVDDDDPRDDGLSGREITLISIFVPIGVILLIITYCVLRSKIKDLRLERLKRQRRERAKRRRIYEHSNSGSSRGMSVSSNKGSWKGDKAKGVSFSSDGLSATPTRPPLKRKARARPALAARQKSNDSLLHSIMEENSSGHEETSRRSDQGAQQDFEEIFGSAQDSCYDGFQSCNLISFGESASNNGGSRASAVSGTNGFGTISETIDFEASSPGASSYQDSYFDNSRSIANDVSAGNIVQEKEDVFGLMNQEGFDTLNPDEFDFDLNMSAAQMSVDEGMNDSSLNLDDGMDLGSSMNYGDFVDQSMEIDFGAAEEDDYKHRIDPNLEFA